MQKSQSRVYWDRYAEPAAWYSARMYYIVLISSAYPASRMVADGGDVDDAVSGTKAHETWQGATSSGRIHVLYWLDLITPDLFYRSQREGALYCIQYSLIGILVPRDLHTHTSVLHL